MSKSVAVYDAWCDGSYRDAHHRGGAGWVVRHDGALHEGQQSLPPLDKPFRPHGSDIAEITAIVGALQTIPTGSLVRLRLDCQNVLEWMKAGRVTARSKGDITPLQNAFTRAHLLAQSMDHVELIKVSGARNELHGRAHVLSRTASTSPKSQR